MWYLLQQKWILKTLFSKKVRVFLAVLGISVGVASVIILTSLGEGSQREVEEQMREFGSNLIVISAGKQQQGVLGRGDPFSSVATLLPEEADVIKSQSLHVSEAAPVYAGSLKVKYGTESLTTSVVATTESFQPIRNHYVQFGDFFNDQDLAGMHRVVVLGYGPYKELFGNEEPLGKKIKINNIHFTVIGVMEPKGVDLTGKDMDDQVFIPVTTGMNRLFNVNYVQLIYLKAQDEEKMEQVKKDATVILREQHRIAPGDPVDFTVQDQSELVSSEEGIKESYQWLLGGIAVITLFIGGIGIMALMLVSIRERTREIGLRLAIGATRKNILSQFVTEAMYLGLFGGISGIILGIVVVLILSYSVGWAVYISWMYVLIAQGVSLAFGLIFGVYPAYKAASLDPIESLRFE